jgi:hypothetical protein
VSDQAKKSSEPVAKRIEVRIFAPGNKTSHAIHLRAGDGRGFTQEGIDLILENCANDIEKKMPAEEYRLVELSENRFNFVWVENERPV